MRFGSMQLRDVLSALQAHFFKCFKQTAQVFWSRFSCGLATKLLAADSHVLAFAAVTRASTKWQARYFIARIFATELSYYACARDQSWQNANAAQQAEPVRQPKRTQ